jgi:uncharacterized protein HemX
MRFAFLLFLVVAQIPFLDPFFPPDKTTDAVVQPTTKIAQPTAPVVIPNQPTNNPNTQVQPKQPTKPTTKENEPDITKEITNENTFPASTSIQDSGMSAGAKAGLIIALVCVFAAGVGIYGFRTYGLQVFSC